MSEEQFFKFDPKVFILPPFITCPKCHQQSFGVLMVSENRFTRRCRDCWQTESFSLPILKKTIIYLDQLALSEMMKALNPQTKAHQEGRVNPFWVTLFEKLDALTSSQLIVCPNSMAHVEESVLSPFNKALRRMYELFSHGVSFHDPWTIERFQTYSHLLPHT